VASAAHPSRLLSVSLFADRYDRWFAREQPGKDPQATIDPFDGDGWNSWLAPRRTFLV